MRTMISTADRSVSRSASERAASRLVNQASRTRRRLGQSFAPAWRRGQDDLPTVGGMRGSLDHADLFEPCHDLGHRRGLDAFGFGELSWGQGAGQFEAGQHGQLGLGEIADRAGLAQPPVEAQHAVAQLGRQCGDSQQLLGSARGGRTSRLRLVAGHLHPNPWPSCRPGGTGRCCVLTLDVRAGSSTPATH